MMINLPYDQVSMSQIAGCQNVPVQTGQNNFQSYQQPQTAGQQLQTSQPGVVCPGNPQGQNPHAFNIFQPDVGTSMFHPGPFNPHPPINHNPWNLSPAPQPYLHDAMTTLPQHPLDQTRGCVSCAAPIFIIPGAYPVPQQPPTPPPPNYGPSVPPFAAQQNILPNYPPQPVYCPPSFYPLPVPLPIYTTDPFSAQNRTKDRKDCDCRRSTEPVDVSIRAGPFCCRNLDRNEHRCMFTDDDTVCSQRNCPLSINLQALTSQLLSMQGIIPCAAIRLVLRKVPGSNVTTSIEDTMERAQNSIGSLTKDQLLAESRYAQQVNALINLHMTTNPPQNVIPILTHIQLKVNVLKALVENLINKKVMENQGVEVEATNSIEPAILAWKTDNELRELLTLLRKKECDERVNLNFSPYRSQRVIAEMRLKNVQNKICQVEAEFERRRCATVPGHSMSYRTFQQFPGPSANFSSLCGSTLPVSPDPFAGKRSNPKRLILRPHVGSPATTYDRGWSRVTTNAKCDPSTNVEPQGERAEKAKKSDACCQDDRVKKPNEDGRPKDPCQKVERDRTDNRRRSPSRSSTASSSCHESSTSDESLAGGKKKLRARVDGVRDGAANGADESRDVCMTKGGQRANVLTSGKGAERDGKKNSGSYVGSTVDRAENLSVAKIGAIDQAEASIDDPTAPNSAARVRAKSDATRESFDQFKPKPMAEEVSWNDDVFENAPASGLARVDRAEGGSGWNDVDVPEGNESRKKKEPTLEILVMEKPFERKDNQRDDVRYSDVKVKTKRESSSSELFSKTEEPVKDNVDVESDALAARESVSGKERSGKFIKIEPTATTARDKVEEIGPPTDSPGEKETSAKTRFLAAKAMFSRADPQRNLKTIGMVERSNKKQDTAAKVTEDAKRDVGEVKIEKMSGEVVVPSSQKAEKKTVRTDLMIKLGARKRTSETGKTRQDIYDKRDAVVGSSETKDEVLEKEQATGAQVEKLKVESSDEVQPRKDVYKSEWPIKMEPPRHRVRTKILKPFEKTLPLRMTRKSKDTFPEGE